MQTWRIEDYDDEEDIKKKLLDKDWLYADDIKNRRKKEDMKEKLSDEDWLHAVNKKAKKNVKKAKKKRKIVDEEMKYKISSLNIDYMQTRSRRRRKRRRVNELAIFLDKDWLHADDTK